MCGIAAAWAWGEERFEPGPVVTGMLDSMRHRGPDDAGISVGAGVALGAARLAIVEPMDARQPFRSEDGRVTAVVNGEIYNHRALRRELEALGHRFRTRSDCEVILHLYEEHGDDLVARLEGQFAFVVHDRDRARLLAGRDRFGICPLYYHQAAEAVLVASEIKALLRAPGVRARVDPVGLDQLLVLSAPVSPRTLFAEIHALPPGCTLAVDARGATVRPYWDLDYPLEEPGPGEVGPPTPAALASVVHDLTDALAAAVADRQQGDGPVAVTLSGGLDSALVAALARRGGRDPVVCFGVDFPDALLSEGAEQRAVAAALGVELRQCVLSTRAVAESLPRVVAHAETPLRETLNAATLALSALVHEAGFKVALTGQGADELFAGYIGYRFDAFDAARTSGRRPVEEHERVLRLRAFGAADLLYERELSTVDVLRRNLYTPAFLELLGPDGFLAEPLLAHERVVGRHRLHRRSYADVKLRLADHLLSPHGDRMAMANSVELRHPFLDPRVVEVARALPPDWLLQDFEEKWVLKQTARELVPASTIEREKFGLAAPASPEILATGAEWIAGVLDPDRIARDGVFRVDAVEALRLQALQPGRTITPPFDDDPLMLVMTYGLLVDAFGLAPASDAGG